MKAWRRALRELHCGGASQCEIAIGAPYLELNGVGWTKVRCAKHAGQPVPEKIEEDLMPRPHVPKPVDMVSTRTLAKVAQMGPKLLKFDHKLAQSGERE